MSNEKIWVYFNKKVSEGGLCLVYLNGAPLHFSSAGRARRKVFANKYFLLECEVIGEAGTGVVIKKTLDKETEIKVVDTKIPEGEHSLKVCNGSTCRFIVLKRSKP